MREYQFLGHERHFTGSPHSCSGNPRNAGQCVRGAVPRPADPGGSQLAYCAQALTALFGQMPRLCRFPPVSATGLVYRPGMGTPVTAGLSIPVG
ncbi:hypothetical protein [Streptomyces sp. NPDC102462]|uniref:hypothetical protein n=1 Tax=Streptomyces sp. NPDC102462 TaxID=3366178 RepID=UPI00380D1EEB